MANAKMGEAYFNLKLKLEELGYNNTLTIEAVPLVECILADLLQTTRSLQHYMELSKEALMQRDSLMLEAEPYRCDNAKLIKENNALHKDMLQLKEENVRLSKEIKRKIKSLTEELLKKDALINKLQHDVRDLSLRRLCAETQSSRNKSRRKDAGDNVVPKICNCNEKKVPQSDKEMTEFTRKIHLLEEQVEAYSDENMLLKSQVEHRDNEITRLSILLEGGRPLTAVNKDCCKSSSEGKIQDILKKLYEMEDTNDILKKEIDVGLEKQHEAMLRALNLAEKNRCLQQELQKVDTLALKVEEDCNKRLAAMVVDLNILQTKIDDLTLKNSELERQFRQNEKENTPKLQKIQASLNNALKENDVLQKEVKDLVAINKNLQDKILSLTESCNNYRRQDSLRSEKNMVSQKYTTKDELQCLLEDERKKYEKHVLDVQGKLTETIKLFNNHLLTCKDRDPSPKGCTSHDSAFVRDLNNKLCKSEQKILMLQEENKEIKSKLSKQENNNKQNYKDVISQLNAENAELSKENIMLSQQLSRFKNTEKYNDSGDSCQKDIQKLKAEIENLTHEIHILRKDKQEYNLRHKEAMDIIDKLKRDLAYKQKEVEHLQEENCSYKITHRTGRASSDHLKDECHFLREQIKIMQSDIIKEKTLASQIKNIQLETERSSTEIQNELLCVQKKLNLSKDTIDSLERKCKESQSEIMSLNNDKSNLISNIKKLDQERDKLVIELDHKTETISVCEQKIDSQTYTISKLESEISELKRKLNINKISEHKIIDCEGQIAFLNGEILKLTQQFETAIMENKHLQNSLADANGTLKITKIEYEKSRKDVEGLKQQLQHYVAEIRRIEEMLSHKEAERSDMLEHFASLSVEANILENNNHSLESESASKTIQLQTYISKIQSLESKLMDKENIIDSQSTHIANMTCRITAMENEIRLITEEKSILEQNILYLKQMYSNLNSEHAITRGKGDADTELKIYENKIKNLLNAKSKLETENDEMKDNLSTTEKLLSNARREVVDLKLALQDAISETKSLHELVSRLKRDSETHEKTLTREELDLPLMLEETIHEVVHEEDEDSSRFHEVHRRYSKNGENSRYHEVNKFSKFSDSSTL